MISMKYEIDALYMPITVAVAVLTAILLLLLLLYMMYNVHVPYVYYLTSV